MKRGRVVNNIGDGAGMPEENLCSAIVMRALQDALCPGTATTDTASNCTRNTKISQCNWIMARVIEPAPPFSCRWCLEQISECPARRHHELKLKVLKESGLYGKEKK